MVLIMGLIPDFQRQTQVTTHQATEDPSAGGLDRPPTTVARPMVSPALAARLECVSEGGVEAAVVGRVVDG